MISFENKIIHLQTEAFSYLFRVTDHGQLEQLHLLLALLLLRKSRTTPTSAALPVRLRAALS